MNEIISGETVLKDESRTSTVTKHEENNIGDTVTLEKTVDPWFYERVD